MMLNPVERFGLAMKFQLQRRGNLPAQQPAMKAVGELAATIES
jgi:hypothetical protein